MVGFSEFGNESSGSHRNKEFVDTRVVTNFSRNTLQHEVNYLNILYTSKIHRIEL